MNFNKVYEIRRRKQDSNKINNFKNTRSYSPTRNFYSKNIKKTDYKTPLILTIISIFIRLVNISNANLVLWDEAFFGKLKIKNKESLLQSI